VFFRRLNWNIVGWFRIVSAISYAVILIGLIVMGIHWHATGSPLRLGLSFTGGTDLTLKFNRSVSQTQIASALSTIGVTDERISALTKSGDIPDSRWTVETQTDFGNDEAVGYLADRLARLGVEEALAEAGAEPGDEVLIGDPDDAVVFDWDPAVPMSSGAKRHGPRGTDPRL